MRSIKLSATIAIGLCASNVVGAAQTVTYSYDALGRLTDVHVVSGPGSGVAQSYQYDAAGNRLQYQVTVPGHASVSITNPNGVANVTPAGVTLSANISGSSAGGTVTFTENGTFLGIAAVVGGGASIVLEHFPSGSHSITATYSGDGMYAPQTATFEIKVRDLRWLPAVLQLLLE